MTKTNEEALKRAVATLNEVTQKLIKGVEKGELEWEYRYRQVSPGVSVLSYLRQLKLAGDLEETDGIVRLKQQASLLA